MNHPRGVYKNNDGGNIDDDPKNLLTNAAKGTNEDTPGQHHPAKAHF
jgi:hypothetical protein